jgi:S-adenosylmethionine hydrolase
MSIITLTTDFGTKDHYVGALKGKLLSENPDVRIVDITHHVDLFNISEASFIIASSYDSFPKGTVHIIAVDAALTSQTQHIAMQWDDHFFISADNGVLSLLTQRIKPQKIVQINIHDRLQHDPKTTDVFVTVANHLAKGGTMSVIGKEIPTIKEIRSTKPEFSMDNKTIKGNVIYIDHFGNIITDVSKKLFAEFGKNRDFELNVRGQKFKYIYNRYADFVPEDVTDYIIYEGKKVAIFKESGLLEIGLYKSNHYLTGSASTLLGVKYRDTILITFE